LRVVSPVPSRALLHFLAIGALLALGARLLLPEGLPEPIVLAAEVVEELRAEGAVGLGRPPGPGELEAWVEARVAEEILLREALARSFDVGDPVITERLARNMRFLAAPGDAEQTGDPTAVARALGMERSDLVVRRRLVQRMRGALEAAARAEEPAEAELEGYLAAHVDRFAAPRRVSFQHVYFARERHGDAEGAARAALTRAEVGGSPPPGDPFLAARDQPLQTEADLARYFGPAFGAALFELPAGGWSGPVESPGGFHLVSVGERQPVSLPALSAVRTRVRDDLQSERADAAVRAFLAERRPLYEVHVAGAPSR
jgi:hypothetical protein